MKPTRMVAAAVGGAAVLNVLARANGSPWLSLAAAATVTLPTVGMLYGPRLGGLTVTRDAPARVVAGQRVRVGLTVANTSRRSSSPARLTDRSGGLDPVTVLVPGLPPGGSATVLVDRQAALRGVYEHDLGAPVLLSGTDPFGMFRTVREVPVPGRLIVHPAPAGRPIRTGGRPGPGQARTAPVPGVGVEILGLRPYRPGDGARAVSARASARHDSAWVLERERDTGPGLVVLAGRSGTGPGWERAVSAACTAALTVPDPELRGRAVPPAAGATAVKDWFAALTGDPPAGPDALQQAIRACGQDGTLVLLAADDDPMVELAGRACRAARVRLWTGA